MSAADYTPEVQYTEKPKMQRADWYMVSAGMTVGQRVCGEGELYHVSELDADGENKTKIPSFKPLPLAKQEQVFGRIMYRPYAPTDEELEDLGYINRASKAPPEPKPIENQEDYEAELEKMDAEQLRRLAKDEYKETFPDSMNMKRMRTLLKRMHQQKLDEQTEEEEEEVTTDG